MNVIKIILSVVILSMLSAFSTTKKLVYIDDWEDNYILFEMNSCCNTPKQIRLSVIKKNVNEYNWKMYGTDLNKIDTVFGKAVYKNKKLKFFVNNCDIANNYFVEMITNNMPVFRLEYDNYYSDSSFKYIDYYMRWYNSLKKYPNSNKLFAGTAFHFKSEKKKSDIKIEK